jgi:hypothetical protein
MVHQLQLIPSMLLQMLMVVLAAEAMLPQPQVELAWRILVGGVLVAITVQIAPLRGVRVDLV